MAMASEQTSNDQGITRGYRVPNFALPAKEERMLLFYEFAHGTPLLLAACARQWAEEECRRFAGVVHAEAQGRGFQSVVLVERPSAIDEGHPVDTAVTAVDAEGVLRRRLCGNLIDGTEGALLVTDPNLRVIDGAAVEHAALASGALGTGMTALIDDCLAKLHAERDAGPVVAPVLVVPRVLEKDVCRALVESFSDWNPAESPMPTEEGLAVNAERKARRDAMIGDATLEKHLMTSIGHRVLPEIAKAFQFRANRFERLKMVCYRAVDSGHFGAHRDNTAPSTVHRRFALTVNLNAGEYEGGELEFPEYGPSCAYDVPAGSAILFSCTHAHRVRPVTRGERYALISFTFNDAAEGN